MSVLPEPMLSVDDVAARLGVPRQTIYEWRRQGRGPRGYRIGRYLRFDAVEVEGWIESMREPA